MKTHSVSGRRFGQMQDWALTLRFEQLRLEVIAQLGYEIFDFIELCCGWVSHGMGGIARTCAAIGRDKPSPVSEGVSDKVKDPPERLLVWDSIMADAIGPGEGCK
jgi:hypothetical protein